mmetsp:Transcript_4088/g.11624  ORF Transcript_4088/g.11624 Transcript_4088/m.11624 type:complete len:273 (-) Transcript_4088:26-844(-)
MWLSRFLSTAWNIFIRTSSVWKCPDSQALSSLTLMPPSPSASNLRKSANSSSCKSSSGPSSSDGSRAAQNSMGESLPSLSLSFVLWMSFTTMSKTFGFVSGKKKDTNSCTSRRPSLSESEALNFAASTFFLWSMFLISSGWSLTWVSSSTSHSSRDSLPSLEVSISCIIMETSPAAPSPTMLLENCSNSSMETLPSRFLSNFLCSAFRFLGVNCTSGSSGSSSPSATAFSSSSSSPRALPKSAEPMKRAMAHAAPLMAASARAAAPSARQRG